MFPSSSGPVWARRFRAEHLAHTLHKLEHSVERPAEPPGIVRARGAGPGHARVPTASSLGEKIGPGDGWYAAALDIGSVIDRVRGKLEHCGRNLPGEAWIAIGPRTLVLVGMAGSPISTLRFAGAPCASRAK